MLIKYLKHNAQFLWRHWNWQLRNFEYIAELSFPSIFYFSLSIWTKHAEWNIGKLFKTNIILVTNINLNWTIVKKFDFFYKKMMDFK